jgi:predicted house-cleaning NTP pyrophosphatase (Maf/HAM1 superfamily)
MDKAGAYGIQGDDGWLIERVNGSRANVMGLPIGEIAPVLIECGIARSTA